MGLSVVASEVLHFDLSAQDERRCIQGSTWFSTNDFILFQRTKAGRDLSTFQYKRKRKSIPLQLRLPRPSVDSASGPTATAPSMFFWNAFLTKYAVMGTVGVLAGVGMDGGTIVGAS
ncbi:hypothetical protein CC2G_014440 [Coprinopsis cinerea AmutBmut pab1-1]|nr:hypothetical protein CC2G_014440 [Coprinopsis cinerea AmutBmut pab1-1]